MGRGLWQGRIKAAILLGAFGLRMWRLAEPLLRWDEGWSIAQAELPWAELLRISALDRHPPLFYILAKPWQAATGVSSFSVRYLALIGGVLTVALAYRVALEWTRNRRVAMLAALYAAWAPLLVYYGQVYRMYAWATVGVLTAAWAVLRLTRRPSLCSAVIAGVATAFGMGFFYHAVWQIAAVYLFATMIAWHAGSRLGHGVPMVVVAGLISVALYAPWAIYGLTTSQTPVYADSTLAQTLGDMSGLLRAGLYGLVFGFGSGWIAVWVTLGLIALGILSASARDRLPVALPILAVGLSLIGVAYGAAKVRFFAVRHLTPAAPFVGLVLAWSLDRLAERWRPALWLVPIGLAVLFWPASSSFVYEKSLEVVDAFDPAADWRYLAGRVGPNDIVFFNNLSKAGWYENARGGAGAPWSYALRWDPIVEPMDVVAARIEDAAREHERLWFVLYKATVGPNVELVSWLGAYEGLYPMAGEWIFDDTLVLGYVAPGEEPDEMPAHAEFEGGIMLSGVRMTPVAEPGGGIALELEWGTDGEVGGDLKVFVHMLSGDGRVLAQHDAEFTGGVERHGLAVPGDVSGRFEIRVGLYRVDDGMRVMVEGGRDSVSVGWVRIGDESGEFSEN